MHIPKSLIETSPVVDDPREIVAILSSAHKSHAPVAGRFADGTDFTGGVVADLTDDGFVLDVGANDAAISRLVACASLDLSLTVGRDRFAIRPVHRRLLRLYGRPAVLYALPTAISHIERRLFPRVLLPEDMEATAVFPIPTPLSEPTSAFSLWDISAAGIGLILPPVGPVPALTREYSGVSVIAGGAVIADLTVQVMNLAPAMAGGIRYVRGGCAVLSPADTYSSFVAGILNRNNSTGGPNADR